MKGDHITSPHGLSTVNAAEVALPPSPKVSSPLGVFTDTSSEQTQQRAAMLEARQERKQLIRAKAQEVRLELLALEQLEKEMDLELDDNESKSNDLDQLFSPWIMYTPGTNVRSGEAFAAVPIPRSRLCRIPTVPGLSATDAFNVM
ncbi:hypothetical protein BGZ95_004657 [Linnemannia exigua]|uniref:Uncharacterized protein n=1 Tax=Linnemannia exigua TaxID=604196 RepID=A0AAD4D2S1_9FUNG|nr:hypothetical protein BGZ95_004657 [Linnemannia exigua]